MEYAALQFHQQEPARGKKLLHKPEPKLIEMHANYQSIVVNATAPETYRWLLRFEDLPRSLTSISKIDNVSTNGFSCTSIINGDEVKTDVLIMMRVPDRRIAWQAVSENFRVGVIVLDPLPNGATRVTVKVRSIIEPVILTNALRQYLWNFKQLVEGSFACWSPNQPMG
jgi:uncharacterized membrane protein